MDATSGWIRASADRSGSGINLYAHAGCGRKADMEKKKSYFVIFFHFPTGNEGVPDNDLNLLKQSKTSLTAVNEA